MPWISGLGNEIKLCLVDTNILSNLAKDVFENTNSPLTRFFNSDKIGICFSIPSIAEIRRNREVFDKFVDLFDIAPAFALNSFLVIRDKEIKFGKKLEIEEVILNSFVPSLLQRDESYNLRWMLNKVYNESYDDNIETALDDWTTDLLNIWKSNFEAVKDYKKNPDFFRKTLAPINSKIRYPRNDFLMTTKKENVNFYAKLVAFVNLFDRTEKKLSKKELESFTNINNYPTYKTFLCLEYLNLVTKNNEVTVNDVYDSLILSPAPYMDIVIADSFQAQNLKNIKSIVPGLDSTEIYTISSLKAKLEK